MEADWRRERLVGGAALRGGGGAATPPPPGSLKVAVFIINLAQNTAEVTTYNTDTHTSTYVRTC